MTIKYLDWITRDMVRNEADAVFVFGDNTARIGLGGQAKAMRGESNVIGVATKRRPSMVVGSFFSDCEREDFDVMQNDLRRVTEVLSAGKIVYVPKDGLGTGLSQLPMCAPRLYKMLWKFFDAHSDEGCPWPVPSP